ncbi:hypothetical protein JCM11641_007999 [Rhodosporidiobolus odoratus]
MAVRPNGLFVGGDSGQDGGKQALFLQIKNLTVPLLDASRGPPGGSTTRTTLDLLQRLQRLLADTYDEPFSPALANYVFFPLSSLLQPHPDGFDRGDQVLEATMHTLSALVNRWKIAGMESRVRQELWIMVALKLGGPLDPNKPHGTTTATDKGKGRASETSDETKLAMVQAVFALMKPEVESTEEEEEDEDDPLGERIDWSAPDPIAASGTSRRPDFSPPPIPILFHTLTTLLSLAAEATSLLQLQLSALEALRVLLFEYLAHPAPSPALPPVPPGKGPSPFLATALPGTASALSRIALSKPRSSEEAETTSRKQASIVIVSALRTLSQLVAETVGDAVTSSLRPVGSTEGGPDGPQAATLEELVDLKLEETAATSPQDQGDTSASSPPAPSYPPHALPTGPTIPTPAWLRFTLTSLSTLFSALSPLSTHPSPLVRTALVELLARVARDCVLTLGEHAAGPLEGLLALASDAWDEVSCPARTALLAAFSRPGSSRGATDTQHPLQLAVQIVQRRLAALPRSIRTQDEHAVQRGAAIVRAALGLLPSSQRQQGSNGVLEGLEKWSWGLLNALELERIPSAGKAGGAGGMALAWITGSSDGDTAGQETSFPPIRLRAVEEAATVAALEALWASLGIAAAAAGQEAEVVDLFLGVALGPRRGEAAATSALWVLDGALQGLKGVGVAAEKTQKKVLRRAVKAVLTLLEGLEVVECEAEEAPAPPGSSSRELPDIGSQDSPSIALVEHKKGVTTTPSLDKYSPVVASTTSRETRASHILLLTSLSLRVLSSLATLLRSSFQPFLMQALYHVLAHLSPTTHPSLRAHAQHALPLLSDATAYASPQNLVLANVDYVVNSVSQRLSVSRLEPSAPLVLVEMIRLVGRPIVPTVQDLVDDVFEALDDYHGYEEVTVGLWAVLDALLKVMEEELPDRQDGGRARKRDEARPDPDGDFKAFQEWFEHRHDRPEKDEDEEAEEEINPQRPFSSTVPPVEQDEASFDDPNSDSPAPSPPTEPTADDKPIPPTRPQLITAQILSKSVYFLSHPSPFLRARVLSLIASAVPLLSNTSSGSIPTSTGTEGGRLSDLLPIIHRLWPLLLLRLSDTEPFVVLSAASLVEALAQNVGDFMSRRVVEEVWPKFEGILGRLEEEKRKGKWADLGAGGGQGGAGGGRGGGKYSTSHRLTLSILHTLLHCARSVPLKEPVVWAQAVMLCRFLRPNEGRGEGAAGEGERFLRNEAEKVVRALAEVNEDAVWLAMVRGGVGEETVEMLLNQT